MLRAKRKNPTQFQRSSWRRELLLANREMLLDGQDLLYDVPTSAYQSFTHGYPSHTQALAGGHMNNSMIKFVSLYLHTNAYACLVFFLASL